MAVPVQDSPPRGGGVPLAPGNLDDAAASAPRLLFRTSTAPHAIAATRRGTTVAEASTRTRFSTLLLRRRRGRVAFGLEHHGPVDLGDVRQSPQYFNFGFRGFQPFVHGVAHQ